MYEKDLNRCVRLRISDVDFEYLKKVSDLRGCSISAVLRSYVGEARRKSGVFVHGDEKTDFLNKL